MRSVVGEWPFALDRRTLSPILVVFWYLHAISYLAGLMCSSMDLKQIRHQTLSNCRLHRPAAPIGPRRVEVSFLEHCISINTVPPHERVFRPDPSLRDRARVLFF